uniref:FXYD domain-containing ion transport regulator n=2 Tax=Panagrellus redivivus TaxID=6233 RepID=A0A7E4W2K2_PANRE
MSFFDRQPAMFDPKKRLGQQQNDRNSDENDSMPESWVELAPSRTSLCSSVEAVMVDRDGFGEAGNSKDSRLSPVSIQSPHVELESNLEQVKYRLAKDMLPSGPRNTDWIWDWSSRPEANPPLKFFRHRGQAGSTLTTPPNTPDPELASDYEYKLEKIPTSVFRRFEVIVGLVVSNLMTFMLGATIGFCICKKLSKNQTH